MSKIPSFRSPLGRVRGSGSAHTGTGHWLHMKLTSFLLVPLTIWFAVSLLSHAGAARADLLVWLSNPFTAALMISFIVISLYHAALGLQVVIDDYIHQELVKLFALFAVKGGLFFAAILAVLSLLKIAFVG
jgi:succinate dehydrogenase / fumarate reductase, membrane anchor subunit